MITHPMIRLAATLLIALGAQPAVAACGPEQRAAEHPRARSFGIKPGVLPPGPLNAITDVTGVKVGHRTLIEGDRVRTGVTVVSPHGGNVFQDKVPAAIVVGNGYGKFAGTTQIEELGEIETPIALTNTLSVPAAMEGLIEWTLRQPGNEKAGSVNAVVGETNDGFLNDIRLRSVRPNHVIEALESTCAGPVAEGNVGAGTGTAAFAWKGGIGTSSRAIPETLGGHMVGVLVQTNYGGVLSMDGAPVGKLLGKYYLNDLPQPKLPDGSVIIIVATDAPLSDRNLGRLARRALLGIGRTGSPMMNGSGDYALAFSVSPDVIRTPARRAAPASIKDLPNDAMTPLFQAAMEATEEAVFNAMIAAKTLKGASGTLEALPHDRLRDTLKRTPSFRRHP